MQRKNERNALSKTSSQRRFSLWPHLFCATNRTSSPRTESDQLISHAISLQVPFSIRIRPTARTRFLKSRGSQCFLVRSRPWQVVPDTLELWPNSRTDSGHRNPLTRYTRSSPLRPSTVRGTANLLQTTPVLSIAEKWVYNFMKLDQLLSSRFSKRYDYERAKCEDSKIIRCGLTCLKTFWNRARQYL